MGVLVKVLQKGKVTIPKELRERLGIKEGQSLTLEAGGGKLVILPSNTLANPTDVLSGLASGVKVKEPVDEALRRAAAYRLDRKRSRVEVR